MSRCQRGLALVGHQAEGHAVGSRLWQAAGFKPLRSQFWGKGVAVKGLVDLGHHGLGGQGFGQGVQLCATDHPGGAFGWAQLAGLVDRMGDQCTRGLPVGLARDHHVEPAR